MTNSLPKDKAPSPNIDEILAQYIMPAHMHNGIDKRAEAKAAIQSLILEARIDELDKIPTYDLGTVAYVGNRRAELKGANNNG